MLRTAASSPAAPGTDPGIKHGSTPDLVVLDDLENTAAIIPSGSKFLLRWIWARISGHQPRRWLMILGLSSIAAAPWLPAQFAGGALCLWRRSYTGPSLRKGRACGAMYSLSCWNPKGAMGLTLFNRVHERPRNGSGLVQEECSKLDPDDPFSSIMAAEWWWRLLRPPPDGESNDYKAVVTVVLDMDDMTYYVPALYRAAPPRRWPGHSRGKALRLLEVRHRDNGFQALFVEEMDRVTQGGSQRDSDRGNPHQAFKEMRLMGLFSPGGAGQGAFPVRKRRNADYNRLMEQLVFFSSSTVHDDGPDALEAR